MWEHFSHGSYYRANEKGKLLAVIHVLENGDSEATVFQCRVYGANRTRLFLTQAMARAWVLQNTAS